MGSEHVPLPPELEGGMEEEAEMPPPPPPVVDDTAEEKPKQKQTKAEVAKKKKKKKKKQQKEEEEKTEEKTDAEKERKESAPVEPQKEEKSAEKKTPTAVKATAPQPTPEEPQAGDDSAAAPKVRRPEPSGPVVVVTAEGAVRSDPPPPYPCIDPSTLDRWGSGGGGGAAAADPLSSASAEAAAREAFFPIRPDLNRILLLWEGNPLHLGVDAVVNSSNESLSSRTGDARELFTLAGPAFLQEVKLLEGCRTGEAKVSDAHGLPNQKIVVHTVGPKFNQKYETAAENALHSCYRSCLAHVVERQLRSVALVTINSPKRGYPRPEACHVALRTIRRFLERYGTQLDDVVLVMASLEDWNVYRRLLPVYFPRTAKDLEVQKTKLPPGIHDTNEFGEKIIKEREIRINTSLFGASLAEEVSSPPAPTAAEKGEREARAKKKKAKIVLGDGDQDDLRAFMTLQKNSPDTTVVLPQNQKKQKKDIIEEEETKKIFQKFLAKAKSEDLSDVARKNAVFHSGVDSLGQPVIVFVGCNFPKAKDVVAMRRFLTYIIRTLDAVAKEKFTAVFLLSETSKPQRPEFAWLQLLYRMWELMYTEQMVNMLVVHPAPWVRFTMTVLKQFTSPRFKAKLKFLDSLAHLFEFVPQDVLKIPNRVYRFDQRSNGGTLVADDHDANEGL